MENLEKWVDLFREHSEKNSKILIIGNKIDYKTEISVMENNKTPHGVYRTHKLSAKTLEGVPELLETIASCLDSIEINTQQPN